MRKRLLSVLIAGCLLTGIFTACGNKEKEVSQETAEDVSLDYILEKKTLVLGLDTSFPPMGFIDSQQKIVGFDIDVAKEVANELGVELVLQPISWEAKELELAAKNIDCIWNGMTVNEDRKANMSLSDSYMENKQVVVVLADSSIEILTDLAGKNVVIQSGSTAQDAVEGNKELLDSLGSLIKVEDNIKAMLDLKIKSSDAVVMDEVVARYYTSIEANEGQYRILEETLSDEEYAIGFRKGELVLTEEVNEILSKMAVDGRLEKISNEWFDTDVTVINK